MKPTSVTLRGLLTHMHKVVIQSAVTLYVASDVTHGSTPPPMHATLCMGRDVKVFGVKFRLTGLSGDDGFRRFGTMPTCQ